jgi:hypothetical protein
MKTALYYLSSLLMLPFMAIGALWALIYRGFYLGSYLTNDFMLNADSVGQEFEGAMYHGMNEQSPFNNALSKVSPEVRQATDEEMKAALQEGIKAMHEQRHGNYDPDSAKGFSGFQSEFECYKDGMIEVCKGFSPACGNCPRFKNIGTL